MIEIKDEDVGTDAQQAMEKAEQAIEENYPGLDIADGVGLMLRGDRVEYIVEGGVWERIDYAMPADRQRLFRLKAKHPGLFNGVEMPDA